MSNPYDDLAPVYDRWITGDPACVPTLQFYLRWLERARGHIVEGGVGTGRIAVELASRNQPVTGIDISAAMLTVARNRARALGLDSMLSLCQMDLLQIGLRRVDVFFLPFRTIGHFVTRGERQRVFKQVFDCLAPGGRFVFDHYVPDLDWARENQSRPLQMFKAAQSADLEIWDTYQFDFNRGLMNCFVEIRRNNSGTADAQLQGAAGRSTVAFTFSWLATDEVREIAAATGFEVESLYGDFDEGPFNAQSEQQIWVLRRPLEDVR